MMFRITLIIIAVLAFAMGGCKKKSEPVEQPQVEVTEENLDSELDKMEANIEADLADEE